MGHVCTSVQSVAKPSLRVQSWRGISLFTQERNLSRWVTHTFLLQRQTCWLSMELCRHILFYPVWHFQSINSSLSVCSARLRAVASGSLWTLTCAHMYVSTPEIAHMCAPLMAAAKNLHSRPTWSLTSSHTPKQKTTNEWAAGPDHSSASVYRETWICLPAPQQTGKLYHLYIEAISREMIFSPAFWYSWFGGLVNELLRTPEPLRQSALLWHYMDEFTVSSCEDVLFMSVHLRNYLYLNIDGSQTFAVKINLHQAVRYFQFSTPPSVHIVHCLT